VLTYRESSLSFLAHQTVPRLALLHEAQRISLLLEPLGVSRQQVLSARPFLAVSPSRQSKDSHYTQVLKQLEAQKSKQGRRGRIFGIAPGSVWGTKRWPANSYAHLISDLLDKDEYLQIVLIGSPAERQQSEQILTSVKNERFFDLVGHTKISDLPQLIATLDILVANDSSPLHYAAAVDTPTVAIFGATTPSLGFGPLAQKKVIVESPDPLPCRPCSDHGPQVCPLKHFDCMRTITVGAVRDAIDSLIKA
jgi:heptosyltransferase-2